MAARASVLPRKRQTQPAEEALPNLEDRIRNRAYEIYVLRGGQSGSELDDWLQAEAELQATGGTK